MPCYKPIQGFKGKNGKVMVGDKYRHGAEWLEVPCGNCIGCRIERSRSWAIRCAHEAQLHQHSHFVTLTYSDEHVPLRGSLEPRDMQQFMKNLRKRSEGPIRFFQCGEYGDKTNRPHHHAIIFGYKPDDFEFWKTTPQGHRTYISESMSRAWNGKGHVLIGAATFESAGYVARYIHKKVVGDAADGHYGARVPEYITMSRRPGIGSRWVEKYWRDVYPADAVVIDGKKFPPPRYYDKWLEENHPEVYDEVKEARIQRGRSAALLDPKEHETFRRSVKEECATARINRLTRDI